MRSALMGTRHGLRWAPESRIGRWTVALAGASTVGVILLSVGFATGVLESAASFSDNWFLTLWGAAVLVTAAGSAVAGAVAVVRRHDRTGSVVLATCFGLLVTGLMLNEVAQGL